MVDNKQLFVALRKNTFTAPYIEGIFSKDTLNEIEGPPKLVICNTAISSHPGKHWVLFFFKDDVVYFYDSLGKNLASYGKPFVLFARKFAKHIVQAEKRTQPKNTRLCGVYCLFMSLKLCKNASFSDIIAKLDAHVKTGKKVCKYVCRKFSIPKLSPCTMLHHCE